MTQIYWLESFSEEEETVKVLADENLTFKFLEEPVQDLDPAVFERNSIFTIRTHSRFTPEVASKARCVISRSTGYDHLQEQQDVLSDTPAGHLSEYATQAVADYNLSLAFASIKRLNTSMKAMETFNRNKLTTGDLFNKTYGIVGVGNIGGATAKHLLNINLEIFGNDPVKQSRFKASKKFHYVELGELFDRCEVIFLCLPHTSETERMIDPLLDRLQPGSFLINTGRGEVVSNSALVDSLENGRLAGAAIDVFNEEEKLAEQLVNKPSGASSDRPEVEAAKKLIDDERVITTPHNAFNSRQALEKKVKLTLDNINEYSRSGQLLNPVVD